MIFGEILTALGTSIQYDAKFENELSQHSEWPVYVAHMLPIPLPVFDDQYVRLVVTVGWLHLLNSFNRVEERYYQHWRVVTEPDKAPAVVRILNRCSRLSLGLGDAGFF